ncbi:hypothetical protein BGZ83_003135 [Gryganskiella cystojenkinii]|nr:hypothetical protein BGZ83_003135 [Gryganskiella cystojenkinii]
MTAGKKLTPLDAKNVQFDLQLAVKYVVGIDNNTANIPLLTRKTAWLLAICGFMRPDDLACADVTRCTIDDQDRLTLCVVLPKERRGPLRTTTTTYRLGSTKGILQQPQQQSWSPFSEVVVVQEEDE